MPLLPVYDWLGLDISDRWKRLLNYVGLVVSGFFIADWLIVHPVIWENDPTILYWVAKPFWVAVPMLGVALWAWRWNGLSFGKSIVVGAVAGVITLQVYYTFIPIPVEGGAIQIGLVGNLTEGLFVHLGAFALVLGGLFLVYRSKYR